MNLNNYFSLLFSFFLLTCTSENDDAVNQLAIPVTKIGVEKKAIPSIINTSGILVAGDETRLAFKAGGIVSTVSVREGQQVHKSQVLASLNLSEITAQVSLARNNYDKTLRDLKRVENLYLDSVATLEQRQNAMTAVEAAYSNLEIAEFNLKHAVIRAPVEGIVLKKYVEINEIVSPGQPVFFFGSSGDNWRVKVGITERDIVKLNLKDSAIVTFDAYPGTVFAAEIVELAGSADPYTGTFEAEIRIEPTDYKLISGFVARVKIVSSRKEEYLLIPIDALYEADGSQGSVFYLPEGNVGVKKQMVTLGPVLGTQVAVRTGLENIDEIISSGSAYLYEGAPVRVVAQEQ